MSIPYGVYDEREERRHYCENCGREFTPPELKNTPLLTPPSQRFCAACWCRECNQDAGLCVGYCEMHDTHLTEDGTCDQCDEDQARAPERMAEQINLCAQALRDGGAR